MNASISRAFLLDAATGQQVEAEVWDAIAEQHLTDWEVHWQPAMRGLLQRLRDTGVHRSLWPQSAHWNWRTKMDPFKGLLADPSVSIVCQSVTQGLMIVKTLGQSRCPTQNSKSVVYVNFLEVAPWNQGTALPEEPRYRGVGSLLLRAAIELSRTEGSQGRIALHSLPQADKWYRDYCRMTDLGLDTAYQGLRYFEMTPEQADAFSE